MSEQLNSDSEKALKNLIKEARIARCALTNIGVMYRSSENKSVREWGIFSAMKSDQLDKAIDDAVQAAQ